jgi:CheY-like chemotaxis protein
MKVLIIEDDEFKAKRIAHVVQRLIPTVDLRPERSVNSGLSAIVDQKPDLVLLDMSLTTFDVGPNEPGGRPQNFGGIEVLRQMDRLQIGIPVVVITQHERFAAGNQEVHLSAVNQELKEQHEDIFEGLIYYNSAAGHWERELRQVLSRLVKKGGRLHGC